MHGVFFLFPACKCCLIADPNILVCTEICESDSKCFFSLAAVFRTKGITTVSSFGASVSRISTSSSKISVRPSLSYRIKSLITTHNVSIRALTINSQVYNVHLISSLYLSQCFLVRFLLDVL